MKKFVQVRIATIPITVTKPLRDHYYDPVLKGAGQTSGTCSQGDWHSGGAPSILYYIDLKLSVLMQLF